LTLLSTAILMKNKKTFIIIKTSYNAPIIRSNVAIGRGVAVCDAWGIRIPSTQLLPRWVERVFFSSDKA
jgi:hypothetical protein